MSIDDDDALVAVVRVPKEEGNGGAEQEEVPSEKDAPNDAAESAPDN